MYSFRLLTLRKRIRVIPSLNMHYYGPVIRQEHADQIDQWVSATCTGTRKGFDVWKMNSPKAITLFKLRWGGQVE